MIPVHTILHPTDFSERSEHAFRYACLLARDLGARLIVLHAVPTTVAVYGEAVASLPPTEELRNEARHRLLCLQAPDEVVTVDHFLEDGDAAEVILRVTRETPCDLIVMGTHGRTGLARLLMGSVAEEVVRKAPCPVLTIKMPFHAEAVREEQPAAAAVPA